jgi:hypothetical protein
MGKALLGLSGLLALFAGMGQVTHAAIIGFDKPLIGHAVTGTTFDNGWTSLVNGDTNVDANAYWYGSPPSGPFNDFEPDPGAIPGYKGGAVWLDSAALPDGAPIIPNSGLEIEKTIGGFGPESLSFFMATEVTSRGQAKGNPGAMFLSINGVQINGNAPDGAFESSGPNPQFSPGTWTKFSVNFTGTGHDVITFRDDETGPADEENLTEESNAVVANIEVVPEPELLGIAGIAVLAGLAFQRKFHRNPRGC